MLEDDEVEEAGQEVFHVVGDCVGLKLGKECIKQICGNYVFAQLRLKELLVIVSLFSDNEVRQQLKCSLQALLPYVNCVVLWVGGLPPLLMVGDAETLYQACRNRDAEIVSVLLQAGIKPHVQALWGRTPLHLAASSDFDDIAALLIAHGADVDAKADGMFPALSTPLHVTALCGSSKVAKLLLDNKCKLDEVNGFGNTSFLLACRGGHVAILQLLLSRFCDRSARNKRNRGPLALAARHGHLQVVKSLVQSGFNINERHWNGHTALHYASRCGHLAVCEFLVVTGAEVDSINKYHQTSFLLACHGDHVAILQLLMSKHCNTAARDMYNDGALAYAAQNGCLQSIKFLVQSGFNINEKQWWGFTALHSACWWNQADVAAFLIASGADVTARNLGFLPYQLAKGSLRTTVRLAKLYCHGSVALNCMKICFVGPPKAGKTTLCKAMRRGLLTSVFSSDENAADLRHWQEHTIGMNVYYVNVSEAGRLVLCDFAGQEPFHGTHSVFFDLFNTIYTMLVNGMDSEEMILRYCHYWCRLLSASLHQQSTLDLRPIVVMVMSRADLHPRPDELRAIMYNVVSQLRKKFQLQLNLQECFFILDCRKSQSSQLKKLREFIAKIKKGLLQTAKQYPRLCKPVVNEILPRLRQRREELFIEKSELTDLIQKKMHIINYRTDVIDEVVDFLHLNGEIFVCEDVVALHIPSLSSYLLGSVMDPSSFAVYKDKCLCDGWVTKEAIRRVLEDFRLCHKLTVVINVEHAVKVLQRMRVCFELEKHPGVYCFPAHLPKSRPKVVWVKSPTLRKFIGRRVECLRETDMFSPGIFPTFQCQAAVQINWDVDLWKGGLVLVDDHNHSVITECLVELTKQERAIDIIVRGQEDSTEKLLDLLCEVMTLLDKLLEKKSPGTCVQKYYLSRRHIEEGSKDPPGFKEEDVLYAQRNGIDIVRCKEVALAETLDDLVVLPIEDNNEIQGSKPFNASKMVPLPVQQIAAETCDMNVAETSHADNGNVFFGALDVSAHVSVERQRPSLADHHAKRVLRAVQRHGSTRWYALGVEMGVSLDQLRIVGNKFAQDTDKLLAVFHIVERDHGDKAVDMLLDACNEIDLPISGLVREVLKDTKQSYAVPGVHRDEDTLALNEGDPDGTFMSSFKSVIASDIEMQGSGERKCFQVDADQLEGREITVTEGIHRLPTSQELAKLAYHIASYWKKIAQNVEPKSFNKEEIEEIEKVPLHASDAEEQALEMLTRWQTRHGSQATVECLCRALMREGQRQHAVNTFNELVDDVTL